MNRRRFLTTIMTGTAAVGAASVIRPFGALPQASAAAPPLRLGIASRTIEVNGKAARVFGLMQPDGKQGIQLDAGSSFDVELANVIDEPTMIHWHGLTPPWKMDGVPDNPMALIKAGEVVRYTFPVGAGGTHWMHAHTLQEQNLLAAPLVVRTAADRERDEQNVVILLHDFSFTPAEELLARLKSGQAHDARSSVPATGQGKMAGMPMMDHSAMGHGNMEMDGMNKGGMPGMDMGTMGAMDLNDIDYDAYLANDRTLDDPEVVQVEKGGRVRLRIINGATATAFTIDTGVVQGTLVAVDGQEVEPVDGKTFPISMGQRLDIRLELPQGAGTYPVLALREGAMERTGVILATAGAPIQRIAPIAEADGPIVGNSLEQRLRAVRPLAVRPADRRFEIALTGQMQSYVWGMDGASDMRTRQGERIEITMRNASMMAHPMHLHGHHFQVTNVNGTAISGAVRDTALVPPGETLTFVFDASNPGKWPLHCHHLYHMATGMMAYVTYEDLG
ncbi:multicopper oxidase family protein [Agrobacterium tumefaciens]|jgi:FtsP/CotA-like multicopper oxidase with cupredoxin domain|uniref:multicopper oxidase family protein n=1 Tax=Rhizobiaceae TaxID=82115 RepID=UPI000DD5F7CF|nr:MULTISPECIES: multicopper oxidase family protein [Hyphomicrobiales]MDG4672920.1 multicopper oxidase family protein [Shinella sp. 838]MDX3928087.1 multicopper oxidase family protein [Shinella sp.]WKL22171.1 multicopper oxidase family protein [Agrobacterium tumefaciens]HBT67500.1 copper oxidase [Agrobacterium sp.]